MKYLFLFTIRPVQSFIAQARKTQDLYAGSQILSELIKTAIEATGDRENVIFPFTHPKENEKWRKIQALPNRFIARFEGTAEEAKALGEKVERKVREKFQYIAIDVLKKASDVKFTISKEEFQSETPLTDRLKEAFKQQTNQHLEIFWLFEPIKEGEYKAAYINIERNLGAIKNVRSFKQYNYNGIGEQGRKCNLDGERNALFFGKDTNRNYFGSGSKWNPNAIELRYVSDVKLSMNEGLSAVSFIKRFYETGKFPSTAEIALMKDVEKLNGKEEQCFEDLQKLFNIKDFLSHCLDKEVTFQVNGDFTKPFDYQFAFRENLVEKYVPNQAQREEALKIIKKLESHLKTKYYAILTFDGDNMGKWLSGDLTPNVDLEKFHKELSKCLSTFAEQAKIQKPEGQDVYAGGDDFLGFVNVHALFDVLKRLREDFDKFVNRPLKEQFLLTEDLTFSAGVAIAHYKMPLDIVLKKARERQEAAKESSSSKNALGLAVLKHSGESHNAVVKWKQIANLQYLVNELVNISDSFSRDIQTEFAIFDDEFIFKNDEMVKSEIKRLIQRKRIKIQFSTKEEKEKYIGDFTDNSTELFDYESRKFSNFKQTLSICQFLNKEIKIKL